MKKYIIQLKNDPLDKIENQIKKLPINFEYKILYKRAIHGFLSVPIPDDVADILRKHKDVLSIEPDLNLQPQWAVERIRDVDDGSLSGHISSEDTDVDIFVIDSGIDALNPNLNVVEQTNFITTSTSVNDVYGHGTLVAGCVGSRQMDIGMAPGARLHSLKVIDDKGVSSMSATISAIDAVILFKNANPDLPVIANISVSIITGSTAYTALDTAIANAYQSGVMVVVAAGNDKKDAKQFTPAHTMEAVVVGAYDKDSRMSTFSNYGKFIDILAPGVDVTTTSLNGSNVVASGTSLSSGYVAGLLGLISLELPGSAPSDIISELIRRAQASGDRIYAAPVFTINYSAHI